MFVDTNIVMRALIYDAPDHRLARAALDSAMNSGRVRISRQIIREFLAVVTRPQPWSPTMPMTEALEMALWMIQHFEILEDGREVTGTLLGLCREIPVGGRQIHDANIVATMLAHGERQLLTFNRRDFERYEPLIELVDINRL